MYLTVPFVLSWSMMDAMSCGAVVLGSATSPIKEMIRDGENGLLADFFKPEEFAAKAVKVLENPDEFRPLGRAAEQTIQEKYSLEAVLPQMLQMYEDARNMPAEPAREPHPEPPPPPSIPVNRALARPRPAKKSPFHG
jgi:glycosyltransferase involved in cell wall biosynthesis